jgi:hypothetical protein
VVGICLLRLFTFFDAIEQAHCLTSLVILLGYASPQHRQLKRMDTDQLRVEKNRFLD